jgi:hypothetical protein
MILECKLNGALSPENLKLNKASRIFMLLDAMRRQPEKTPLKDAWASVFGYSKDTIPNIPAVEISLRLAWVYEELRLLEDELRQTNVPESHWRGEFNRLSTALNQGTQGQIANIRSALSAEVLKVFQMLSADCVNDSVAYSESDLQALKVSLDNLESLLEDLQSLPAVTKAFLLLKIKEMRDAIDKMVISGTRAVRGGLDSFFGGIQLAPDTDKLKDEDLRQISDSVMVTVKKAAVVAGIERAMDALIDSPIKYGTKLLGGM